MVNLPVFITILVIAFLLCAWLYFAEISKNPETFVGYMKDNKLIGLTIYDPSGNILYSVDAGSDASGIEKKTVTVTGCTAFVVNYGPDSIVGIGPFADNNGKTVNIVLGQQEKDHQLCTNTEEIRRFN